MKFVICSNGTTAARSFKFKVPAVRSIGPSGVWSEPDKDILVPDFAAVLAQLPARWNGAEATGGIPHAELTDARGNYLFSLYAIPCN